MNNSINELKSKKNSEIISKFYCSNQTFVTKEELINVGFDFSEWFSTSNMSDFFDIEENSFQYKDFKCGDFYIKTRDKNLENPKINARLFFEIIMLDFTFVEYVYKQANKFLHDRKFTDGTMHAYIFDSEMRNLPKAEELKIKLERINQSKQLQINQLKHINNCMEQTQKVFQDLISRIEKDATEDENWI